MWWALIPAALSAASSISQYSQGKAASANQAAWQNYNAKMQYGTDMMNIQSSLSLAGMNLAMAQQQAGVVAAVGSQNAKIASQLAEINANIVSGTTQHNDLLYEQELEDMWDQNGLDLDMLHRQRAKERGVMLAGQAASGTVINEGSNAEAIISQSTEEALDAFVIRHNADKQAAKISNARAFSMWEGENKVKQIIYEGKLSSISAITSAQAQISSIASGAMSQYANTKIGAFANTISAKNRWNSNIYAAQMGVNANNQVNQNNLVQGMFSAAGQGISAYYKNKPLTDSGSLLS